MAARISTSITFNREQLEAKFKRASRFYVERSAEAAGPAMVSQANTKMAGLFNLNRDPDRRRYKGSRRAATSLDYEIVEIEPSVFTVAYTVEGGDVALKKIIFMNYGTGAHEIKPINGRFLVWPAGSSRRKSWDKGRARKVDHPGQAGQFFLEEVAETIAERIRTSGNALRARG